MAYLNSRGRAHDPDVRAWDASSPNRTLRSLSVIRFPLGMRRLEATAFALPGKLNWRLYFVPGGCRVCAGHTPGKKASSIIIKYCSFKDST